MDTSGDVGVRQKASRTGTHDRPEVDHPTPPTFVAGSLLSELH